MKYPNARIFQGNELLVLAVRLFDAGRDFQREMPTGHNAAMPSHVIEERKRQVTALVEGAQTKIPADEPWFLLRGQDRYAPTGIARYARACEERGAPRAFVDGVVDVACAMEDWQAENADRVKRPD